MILLSETTVEFFIWEKDRIKSSYSATRVYFDVIFLCHWSEWVKTQCGYMASRATFNEGRVPLEAETWCGITWTEYIIKRVRPMAWTDTVAAPSCSLGHLPRPGTGSWTIEVLLWTIMTTASRFGQWFPHWFIVWARISGGVIVVCCLKGNVCGVLSGLWN